MIKQSLYLKQCMVISCKILTKHSYNYKNCGSNVDDIKMKKKV